MNPDTDIDTLKAQVEQRDAEIAALKEKLDWQNMPNRNPSHRGGYEFYINEEWKGIRAAALDAEYGWHAALRKRRIDPDDDRVRVRLVLDDDAILEDLATARAQAAAAQERAKGLRTVLERAGTALQLWAEHYGPCHSVKASEETRQKVAAAQEAYIFALAALTSPQGTGGGDELFRRDVYLNAARVHVDQYKNGETVLIVVAEGKTHIYEFEETPETPDSLRQVKEGGDAICATTTEAVHSAPVTGCNPEQATHTAQSMVASDAEPGSSTLPASAAQETALAKTCDHCGLRLWEMRIIVPNHGTYHRTCAIHLFGSLPPPSIAPTEGKE